MNTNYLKFGGLAVVGVLAYLYIKPKLKAKSLASNTSSTSTNSTPNSFDTNTNSQSGTTPMGQNLTVPDKIVENAQIIAEAQAIATKINEIRITRKKIDTDPPKVPFGLRDVVIEGLKKDADKQTSELEKVLIGLGYSESNGKIIKIG